jgi:drug/metabolite transporter (DMT)-like permease
VTLVALALVLSSAVVHASWNLIAKRVQGGVAFLWLFDVVSVVAYAPAVAVLVAWQRPHVSLLGLVFMAGSGAFHLVYFVLLTQGYRAGDLSLVYPLARGSGPLLATAGAIVLLGERPSPLALAGGLLVVGGGFVVAGDPRRLKAEGSRAAVAYALLTGSVIGVYTLWDKHAVAGLLVPPLLYNWGIELSRLALLSPLAARRQGEVVELWRNRRWEVVAVGLLSPLAYILVLTALAISPVYFVAPAREVGILIGAALGARLLSEGNARRRLPAAAAVVAGVVLLATR